MTSKILEVRVNNRFLWVFWYAPFVYLYFLSLQLLNERELGAGIYPSMALDTISI